MFKTIRLAALYKKGHISFATPDHSDVTAREAYGGNNN
jgi:hypothetical protein